MKRESTKKLNLLGMPYINSNLHRMLQINKEDEEEDNKQRAIEKAYAKESIKESINLQEEIIVVDALE